MNVLNNKTGNDEIVAQLRLLTLELPDGCWETAVNTYQNARIDGLCHDGAWEIALETIRIAKTKPTQST